VSHVGFQDRDILPHWVRYYRSLGVDDVHVNLHGGWSERRLLSGVCDSCGATIVEEYDDPYADQAACAALNRLIRRFVGEWVLVAGADEFVELPFSSLAATLRALRAFGLTALPAIMVHRVTADGSLLPVEPTTDLASTFAFANTLLIERMQSDIEPQRKSKYPLFFVNWGTRVVDYLPPDKIGVNGFGLRAVSHHYKWRAALLSVIEDRTRNKTDQEQVVAGWLATHNNRLPMEGAFVCNRDELLRRGLLRRPTRKDIAMGVLLHRVRLNGAEPTLGLSRERLDSKLCQLEKTWRSTPQNICALPRAARALASQRADIGLVTGEISPPVRTGGICSWVNAAAASLKRAGHSVTVIYAPDPAFPPFTAQDQEVWDARGIEVVIIERTGRPDTFTSTGSKLLTLLEQRKFDLVHFADVGGYGALCLAAKRQGHGLHCTRFIVTVHGPADWHRRGNDLRRSEWDLRCAHAERMQIETAEELIVLSNPILTWLGTSQYRVPPNLYLHRNSLPHAYWTGHKPVALQRAIRRLVFFGRLEPRKGLILFCDAIDQLDSTDCKFEVVLLGRIGNPQLSEYIAVRTEDWACRVSLIENWTTDDALLLLGEPGTLAVVPSLVDNSPYSVLECLGAGIPFIASNVGGIPELIHPEDRERVLVRPEPADLAAALERALREGHAPARPAHDFAEVELKWLAWHGSLLAEQRAKQSPSQRATSPERELLVTVIAAASEQLAPWCLASLKRQDGAIEVLSEVREGGVTAAMANTLAARAQGEFLVFCGPRIVADGGAVAALVRASLHTGADAVVAAHRLAKGSPYEPESSANNSVIYPTCGPLAIAALENVFGGRFFLIRRAVFETLGGFRLLKQLEGIEHRDLLNRLLLKGGHIVSVPYPLYVEYKRWGEVEMNWLSAKRACLEPFLTDTPRWLSELLSWVQDSGWPGTSQVVDDIGWSIAKAAAGSRLARIRAGTMLASFRGANLRQLEAHGDAEIRVADDHLNVMARGPDPILLLPPLTASAKVCPLHLIIDIAASAPSEAQLYWSDEQDADYVEDRSIKAALSGERQTIILTTPPINIAGRLRFDPGNEPGQYSIFGVEAWTESDRVMDRALIADRYSL
jgi:glycosyltransferase involved in cell wall biosynthesis